MYRTIGCSIASVLLTIGGLAGCSNGEGTASAPSTTRVTASTTTASPTTAATSTPDAPSGPEGGPVPAGFTAASVTFVSLRTGWVLGTAPCGSPPCTSLVRTRDGGQTWVGIPAPAVKLSGGDRSAGVRQVRFADTVNGWAFGPDLWTTHDGGAHWAPTTLPGVEAGADVFDLEAGSGSVHVAVIDSSSTAVRILTSPADRDGWTLSPTKVQIGGGPVPLAQVVTQGATGWVLEVDRVVVGGARLVGDAWQPWPPPCVDAGGSAFLAASTPSALVAVCNEGQWNERPRVVGAYLSGDNGTTFSPAPVLVPLAEASAVASATPGVAVVAGRTEGGADVLVATFDGGATWTTVHTVDGDRSWNDLGFTSATQGVVVEISSAGDTGSLLMTLDAGHTWHQVPIS